MLLELRYSFLMFFVTTIGSSKEESAEKTEAEQLNPLIE